MSPRSSRRTAARPALVQHHVKAGAANHIVAAYECLLHAGKDAAVQQPAAGAAA